jgi:hypothetical protein
MPPSKRNSGRATVHSSGGKRSRALQPERSATGVHLPYGGPHFLADNRAKEGETAFRSTLIVLKNLTAKRAWTRPTLCITSAILFGCKVNTSWLNPFCEGFWKATWPSSEKTVPRWPKSASSLATPNATSAISMRPKAISSAPPDMREVLGGRDSTDLAAALRSLVLCYSAQNKFGRGEPLFKLSLNSAKPSTASITRKYQRVLTPTPPCFEKPAA